MAKLIQKNVLLKIIKSQYLLLFEKYIFTFNLHFHQSEQDNRMCTHKWRILTHLLYLIIIGYLLSKTSALSPSTLWKLVKHNYKIL